MFLRQLLLSAAAIAAALSCSSREPDRHAGMQALPVDTVRAGLDAALHWQHRTGLDVDLNGDGEPESLVVASDVTVMDSGEPIWEDGHRWAVYVEDSAQRTLLYSSFLPHGVAEVAIGTAGSDGSRDVLIVERTPQHSRAVVVHYQRAGVARLVSDANYPLDRWLQSLTGVAVVRERAATPVPERAAAPWSRDSLTIDEVPAEYARAWKAADNRSSCALIAPANVRVGDARPRIAEFAGGWAVAYDTPNVRSAFGVAGTGTTADGIGYDDWPNRRQWADGSSAGWGPEGGTGPNQLAYLRIAGQGCLYNVWSRLGGEHLSTLLLQLRFVRAAGDPA